MEWEALRNSLANAYDFLAVAHYNAGAMALNAIEVALTIKPSSTHFHANRDVGLVALGHLDNAEHALDYARTLNAKSLQIARSARRLATSRASQHHEERP